jgi:AcrR family transcriptional regulator
VENRRKAARWAEVERNDRALLEAARTVVAEHGAHASVATIAARAGVGIGTLYRRYRTKEQLFQRLCVLAMDQYATAAEEGLELDDPWEGFAHFVSAAALAGTGALGPIAGSVEVTDEMSAVSARGDAAADEVIHRAQAAGVLREDVGPVDVALLIEQLGRSPLVEQVIRNGSFDMLDAAEHARRRLIAVAIDGLLAPARSRLPGAIPEWQLFTERWRRLEVG